MSDVDDQVSDKPEIPALPARLAQVIFSPGALFERLRERPVWLGALLTAVVLSVAANLLIPEELIRQLIMEQMPDDADPSGVETALRIAGILRLVGPIVFPPLLAVFLAAVVLLIYNLLAGGEASFAQAMSATSHVLFIPTLGGLLTVPLILAAGGHGPGGQDTHDKRNPRADQDFPAPAHAVDAPLSRFTCFASLFGYWYAVGGPTVSARQPKRAAPAAFMTT